MRQGQNSKRSRGRGSGRRNVPPRHQTFDSNGPSVRIRGSAYQVHEKYLALARDAGSAGDRIAAENYLQHAEHYFRIINMDNDGDSQSRGRSQQNGSDSRSGHGRDAMDGADAVAKARREQPDATAVAPEAAAPEAAAPEAEVVQANGAGEQPDVGPGDADGADAAESAPKRRASRGNGKGRRTRTKSKASDSGGDEVSAGSNGADEGEGDVPPADE